MSIQIKTNDPVGLLKKIKEGIVNGDIETWVIHPFSGEEYFKHDTSSDQWLEKAFLLPEISDDFLLINVIRPQGMYVTQYTFAVYQGRFIQMLIAHFPDYFTSVSASSKGTKNDIL